MIVNESYCGEASKKNIEDHDECNTHPCPTWKTSEWNKNCSINDCNDATVTKRFRTVHCEYKDEKVGLYRCNEEPKPNDVEECPRDVCASWRTSEWSSCSVSCGSGGVRTRSVSCTLNNKNNENSDVCDVKTKPNNRIECSGDLRSCEPEWQTTEWSACSVSCGVGTKTRHVYCLSNSSESNCNLATKPQRTEVCTMQKCLYDWKVGEWSQVDRSNLFFTFFSFFYCLQY
jgi:hypothetical protein